MSLVRKKSEPKRKCFDANRFCQKCQGYGFYYEQPLSSSALDALADAVPDEEVIVVQTQCTDCGGLGIPLKEKKNGPRK